jgi:hypothetical protein
LIERFDRLRLERKASIRLGVTDESGQVACAELGGSLALGVAP